MPIIASLLNRAANDPTTRVVEITTVAAPRTHSLRHRSFYNYQREPTVLKDYLANTHSKRIIGRAGEI